MKLFKQDRWYLYELADPRTGQSFYVGKGKQRRAWMHERLVQRGRGGRDLKSQRIREILQAGFRIDVRIVQWFDDEEDAYAAERDAIAEGRGPCNMTAGGDGGFSGTTVEQDRARERRQAIALRKQIIPFDVWCRVRQPTPDDIEMYHLVVRALETCSA